MLGIKNGEVAELALKEDAIIITLDSDFLQLQKAVQKKKTINLERVVSGEETNESKRANRKK